MNRLLCALIVVLIAYIRRPQRPELPAWVSAGSSADFIDADDLQALLAQTEVEPSFEECVEDAIDMIDGMGEEENELLANILLDPCYVTVDAACN